MENIGTPTALILSRQNIKDLPAATGNRYAEAQQISRGAYVVQQVANPDVVLLANGSEVATLVDAAKLLGERKGLRVQVVSAPSEGLFFDQDKLYRDSVLPVGVPVFGLTAGLPSTLHRFVGAGGAVFGLDHFGYSAPYKVLDEKFGFTDENVVAQVEQMLA
jgi:transketolase